MRSRLPGEPTAPRVQVHPKPPAGIKAQRGSVVEERYQTGRCQRLPSSRARDWTGEECVLLDWNQKEREREREREAFLSVHLVLP